MASDLARLFALAHDYHLNPSLYESRASAYEVKNNLFRGFIDIVMNPNSSHQQILNIASKLNINSNDVSAAGLNYMQKILFSADRNHYQILGLGQDASTETIRKRYRYLIAMFHPDKCAAHHLDGELYAALLNNAYSALKNSQSRQLYDETLIAQSRLNHMHSRAANDPDLHPTNKNGTSKKSSIIETVIDAIPVIRHYPNITIWGVLGISFLIVIYLTNRDTVIVELPTDIAVKPVIELREREQLKELDVIRKSESDKDELSVENLKNTVNSDKLAGMLDGSVKNEGSDTKQEEAQQLSDNAAVLGDGFDGGVPGTPSRIRDIVAESGGIGDHLPVETFFIPPELMMMEFIQSYETGDIDKFSRLFTDDVKTNQGRGREQLVTQFTSLFDTTTSRKIKIKQLRVEPKSHAEALLISEIEAAVKHSGEPTIRHFNGELVFRLVADESSMLIAEMAHSVH